MPVPGSVWAPNTWSPDAWAANTWASAGDAPVTAPNVTGAVYMTRARTRRRRDFLLCVIAWLFPPNRVIA